MSLRAKYFTASEASAMMGVSKYQTRNDLIKAKATGITPEVDSNKQRLFDRGHAAEEAIRPVIEALLETELSNITGSLEVEDLPLLASFDGISMLGDVIWETKLLNEKLKEDVQQGQLHLHYAYQIEQQLLVSGAEKCYFTTSDGTAEGTYGMWYYSLPELRAGLIAGWKQFAIDLAAYVHVVPDVEIVAAPVPDFPALFVQAKGEVMDSNLSEVEATFRSRLDSLRKYANPANEQERADGKANAKKLREFSKRIRGQTPDILAQAKPIGDVVALIKRMAEEADALALSVEKAVASGEQAEKDALILTAKVELDAAIKEASFGFGAVKMPTIPADFAGAIKSKRNTASMKNAVDSVVAAGKILAKQYATAILANLSTLEEANEFRFLFPDSSTLALKAPDDLAAAISSRIAAHKEKERVRIETEAAHIRAEEERRKAAADQAAAMEEARKFRELFSPAAPQPPAPTEQPATASEALIINIIDNLRRMDASQLQLVEHYTERLLEQLAA